VARTLNIGIVGAGGFAAFASKAFIAIEGVRVIAVSDINQQTGKLLAHEMEATFYSDYQELVANKYIHLIYIATPPFLHYQISKHALLAGKHVICEKPAALKVSEAVELKRLAEELNLLYVVNLMQRYNPLYAVVKQLIEKETLGKFLHGYFENYASDEFLDEQHWFWDEAKSGGIFIEHGVHFFDMFSGWLGRGEVINAIQIKRENIIAAVYDRVQASVSYNGGVVNFYHGFDQPKVLDRQEIKLEFERGDITLYEWVPVRFKMHGLFTKQALECVKQLTAEIAVTKHDSDDLLKTATGRFKQVSYTDLLTIEFGNNAEKQHRYQQMLTAMLQDQWNWICDRNHKRIIDDDNAVESLGMAEQAKQIAQNF
jgi:predicted dehydrogenase